MSNKEVVIGLHLYQPPRQAHHQRLAHLSSDSSGIDWTRRITDESYRAMRDLRVLPRVSFDCFGVLDDALEAIDPGVRDAMRAHLGANGVADTYIHPLLPDLSSSDQQIVIGAGIKRYRTITGVSPKFFWLPEAAISTSVLHVLAQYGVLGFFCSPEQVWTSSGERADNTPLRIDLSGNASILALPFDGALSHKLAFEDNPHDPLRADAYKFRDRVVIPGLSGLRNGFPLLGYTDGETFGHHMQWGVDFLNTLVNHALPQDGIRVVSINEVDFNTVSVARGGIHERSAWSCAHGNLARWRGECDCGAEGLDQNWKKSFYQALHGLNDEVSRIAQAEFGSSYVQAVIDGFEQGFKSNGLELSSAESLTAAKVSALTSLTSCGTFYKDPGVSGGINILFARQAVEHLVDAGLAHRATRLWTQFLDSLRGVNHPGWSGHTVYDQAGSILGGIA